jgi:hypothetical protein
MRVYRDRNSPFTYPTGLVNKGFTLLLTFNSGSILSDLGALSDALLGRQSHNNALIASEIRFLFQLNRDSMAR